MANSPPLVIAGCIQVRLAWIIAGQGAFNVLHFTKPGTTVIDQTDAEAIGAAAKTAYTARLAPLQPANCALARVSVRDLSAPNQPEYQDTGAAVGGSDAVGEPLPAGVALCVTIRTALAGKSFRGRVYIGGFSESQNTNVGETTPAAQDGARNFLGDFADAMEALGFVLGVASRPSNASQLVRRTALPNGDVQEDVLSNVTQKAGGIEPYTSLQTRTLSWESQRKRQNGRGGVPAAILAGTSRTRRTR